MLPMTVKSKEAPLAVVSVIVDARLRERNMEGFCDTPYPFPDPCQDSHSLDREILERILKKCYGDAEVWLSTIGGL